MLTRRAAPETRYQPLIDSPRIDLEWRAWRFPLLVALFAMIACTFATFVLPDLLGRHEWLRPGDGFYTIQSATFAVNGGIGSIYSVNAEFLPLPGFLIIMAPAAALGQHFGWVNGIPFHIDRPSMMLAAMPVFFASGATAVLGVDYLADTLGVAPHRRRILAVAIGALVVIPTCCVAGHPEDLLCLALSALSLALLMRRRCVAGAAVLAVAVLMQPWAALLVPLLIATSPPGQRVRCGFHACALPGLTAALLFAFDFKDAFRSLVVQPMPFSHGQRLPWWALAHTTTFTLNGSAIVARVGSVPRSAAVVVAVVGAVAIRRHPGPRQVMAVATLDLAARGVFETQVWSYYMAPAAVFLAVGAAAFAGPGRMRWLIGCAAAFFFYAAAAGAYAQASYSATLAFPVLVMTAGVGLWAADLLPGRRLSSA